MSAIAGESTGSVPVKFGIGTDGRQIPISERISLALAIKREQQQQLQGDSGPITHTGSARTTPSKVRGASASRAAERQQENYQNFKASVSEHQLKRQQKEQQQQRETVNAESDEADADLSEQASQEQQQQQQQQQQGEGDFSEYASPDASRKSSSRSKKAGESSSGEQRGADGTGDAQSSLASGVATDWIECLDPRSKRKYYYSAALKKSTWVKPAGFVSTANGSRVAPGTPTMSSMGVTMPSRYTSPNVSMHMSGRQAQDSTRAGKSAQRMTAEELSSEPLSQSLPVRSAGHPSSLRSASPYSTSSSTAYNPDAAAASPAQTEYANVFTSHKNNYNNTVSNLTAATVDSGRNSAYNSRSSSPAVSTKSLQRSGSGGSSPSARSRSAQASPAPQVDWVTAVDPNSNRKYWYNR